MNFLAETVQPLKADKPKDEPTHSWGWIIDEPVYDDPTSIIYLDSRYEPTTSPSWPPGYKAPPLPAVVGVRRNKDKPRYPMNKRKVVRKSHQYRRICERLQQAHIDNKELFTHPIVIGARYNVYPVPNPTDDDMDLPNRRLINGVLYTYRKIDKNYKGVTKTTAEMTEKEREHQMLSNFRSAKVVSK